MGIAVEYSAYATDGNSHFVDDTSFSANAIQAIETDGFQVGTASQVNDNGVLFSYFMFKTGTTPFPGPDYPEDISTDASLGSGGGVETPSGSDGYGAISTSTDTTIGQVAVNEHETSFYVTNMSDDRIEKYDLHDKSANVTQTDYDSGTFSRPEGACHSNDRLYICDTGNHTIVALNEDDLSYVKSFGTYGTNGDSSVLLNAPRGITASESFIYVVDGGNDRIVKLTHNLDYVTASTDTKLSSPTGIAYDGSTSRLFVGDSGHNQVAIFNTALTYISSFGTDGVGTDDFDYPAHTQVIDGQIAVADCFNNRVVFYETDGTYLGIATDDTGSGTLFQPYGLGYWQNSTLITEYAGNGGFKTWYPYETSVTSNSWTSEDYNNKNIDWGEEDDIDTSSTEETAIDSTWTQES